MANVGVTFDFAAESAKLRSEIDKVRKELSGIRKSADAVKEGFKTLGGVIVGALSIGAVTSFLSKVNQAADQLNDLSTRLGASASGLQALQVAAQQAGGSAEAMATGLSKLQVTIGEGLQGSKKAAEAFAQLGLSAQELAGLKTDEAMRRVAVALSEVENANVRAQIGTDLLGKGFKENAGFFADAAGNLDAVNQALTDAGAALSDLDVAKIGVMNDELALQGTIVQNLGTKFLSNLSPAVGVAVDAFANLIKRLGGATKAGETFGVVMVAAIKTIEAGVYSLAGVFETLRAGVALVLQGITAGVSGLVGLLARAADAAGLDVAGRLQKAADIAGEFSQSLGNVATTAWANAKAAGAAALQAAAEVLNAEAIFDQYAARLEQRAAAAAAQAAGVAEGAIGGAAGAAAAGGQRAGIPLESLRGAERAIEQDLDVLSDPKILRQMEINAALQAIEDQHSQTMLGKIEAFNETALGSILNYGQRQIDWEQSKSDIIGGLADGLVGTAMQAGGRLGKFGKALAIAQTIWSTGQAIMNAMAQVPWPANIAAAAMAAGMGIAQLANIKKTNLGSGGSVIGARGGGITAAAPALTDNVSGAQPQQELRTATQVIIQGNVFSSQETASWIIDQIRDAVESRDVVFISSNSRQAMELAGT